MGNDYIEAARVFHDLTKHSYTSVRSSPNYLDWDNRPAPYKIYPEAGALALPRDLNLTPTSTLAALTADAPSAGGPLSLEMLTRLLFSAGGLIRNRRVGTEDYHFRAAASAGALYPIEIYVAASAIEGLEDGLYHFSPADLKLRGLRRGDWRQMLERAAADCASIGGASAIAVLTSIFWRSTWKYHARAYRYCFWDAGTILANLIASASAERVPVEVITTFVDSDIERLLGIDGDQEGAVAMVPLGTAMSPAEFSPEITPARFETVPLSSSEVTYDTLIKIHRESRLETADEARSVRSATIEPATRGAEREIIHFDELAPEEALGLGETILRRGSTRVFAREPIAAEELQTILVASNGDLRCDFPPIVETYLIVNAVTGMDPGAYYFDRDAAGFELIKAGDFRFEAGYLCLEQALGRDSSALIVYMADLERVLGALGNRGYRDVHLEAGIRGGRAYLAAYSLNRGASGLTFYDDDTTRFFEPRAAGKSPLLMVAIGVPRTRLAEK